MRISTIMDPAPVLGFGTMFHSVMHSSGRRAPCPQASLEASGPWGPRRLGLTMCICRGSRRHSETLCFWLLVSKPCSRERSHFSIRSPRHIVVVVRWFGLVWFYVWQHGPTQLCTWAYAVCWSCFVVTTDADGNAGASWAFDPSPAPALPAASAAGLRSVW